MAEEKKDSKSKIIIVLLIVVIVLLIGGGAAAFLLMNNNGEGQTGPAQTAAADTAVTAENKNNSPLLKYDDAAVALDENGLEKQIEEMKNSEGNISLEYKNEAESTDGTHFICYLANSDLNTEDMFIAIFTDANMTEQVYLSGLLRPGTSIQEFDSEIPFEKGKHSVVCMFTSVGDDHESMTSQIAVEVMLTVK